MEDCLILDELLLLTERLNKKRRHELRTVMLGQGIDIDENEEEGEELDPEVAEAEKRFKEERLRKRAEKAAEGELVSFGDGLGYEVVS